MSISFAEISILISLAALFLSSRADRRQKEAQEREEKSAVLHVRPLIQTRPVAFSIHQGFGQTILEVLNDYRLKPVGCFERKRSLRLEVI